jgi:hypothetical protein
MPSATSSIVRPAGAPEALEMVEADGFLSVRSSSATVPPHVRLAAENQLHDLAVELLGGSGGAVPPDTTAQQYADALERARVERGGA